jgi:hypothetical protein
MPLEPFTMVSLSYISLLIYQSIYLCLSPLFTTVNTLLTPSTELRSPRYCSVDCIALLTYIEARVQACVLVRKALIDKTA